MAVRNFLLNSGLGVNPDRHIRRVLALTMHRTTIESQDTVLMQYEIHLITDFVDIQNPDDQVPDN